jgi:hypothetical protein
VHLLGAVVFAVKHAQVLRHPWLRERRAVACAKVAEHVSAVANVPQYLPLAPRVADEVLAVLRVDGRDFLAYSRR